MRFSERIGKTQPKTAIQIDAMDAELKNSIWNVLTGLFIEPMKGGQWLTYSVHQALIELIWFSFFKEPIDQIPFSTRDIAIEIRNRFYRWDYLKVYDFIDFLAQTDSSLHIEEFVNAMNLVLKRELSGYRFIDHQLAPITNEQEINEIDNALKTTSKNKLKYVNSHLSDALNKLSDRKAPDFRNSIKESISAVESICQIITGEAKTELGKTLKVLKDKLPIHGALEQGFIKIYGYTSDSDGIRHAMMDESNLDQEDALFMLVSCSAFINYLIAKSVKAGIDFN